jgi:C4-dicarboxylate transporter, DctM subunit
MNEIMLGLTGLLVLFLLFATGMEMGFAMIIVGFAGFACTNSLNAAMDLLARDLFEVATNYAFTVFPLFMLMGQVGFHTGIALRLYDTAHKWVGHIPGGLAMATVAGATGFKAICGSSSATAATFASVAVPEMDRFGYDRKLSTGIVAIVGTLGCIIPPSVVLILFGLITEQSIGQLFLAGIIPGLIIAIFFIFIIYGWAKVDPKIAPKALPSTWKQRWSSLPDVAWVLVIFFVVVGGVMQGYFTPTEAGAVGTFAVLVLSLAKKEMTFKKYLASMWETIRTTGMITLLLVGSMTLGHFITATNIPKITADWVVGLPLNRYVILILILIIYQIGGSFIEDLAFMILATPIFFPAVVNLGFNPIWFGILMAVSQMIGVVIPPVAVCVFVVKNMTKVPVGTIYKGIAPFLLSLIVMTILLFAFPQIALWLPSLFYQIAR